MKKVIGKNVVIKHIDEEIKTESGILLSGEDVASMRYKKGVVVMPGSDVSTLNPGDTIFYDKSNSYTMLINDEQMTIIQERDVVVVF